MDEQAIELSVVIPCLNEADTLVVCIQKAHEGMKAAGCHGEIVVADNGSNDGSQQLAVGADIIRPVGHWSWRYPAILGVRLISERESYCT